jgi:hypothetical protein
MRFIILVGKNNVGIMFRKFRIISALRLHIISAKPKIIVLGEIEATTHDTPDTRLFNISTRLR